MLVGTSECLGAQMAFHSLNPATHVSFLLASQLKETQSRKSSETGNSMQKKKKAYKHELVSQHLSLPNAELLG